ncbi:hypothetical protein HDU86_006819 [Geranomyces michiganensis]|nr:hypothetical protein HDU86_006819 [Geranomyces michiganensis]
MRYATDALKELETEAQLASNRGEDDLGESSADALEVNSDNEATDEADPIHPHVGTSSALGQPLARSPVNPPAASNAQPGGAAGCGVDEEVDALSGLDVEAEGLALNLENVDRLRDTDNLAAWKIIELGTNHQTGAIRISKEYERRDTLFNVAVDANGTAFYKSALLELWELHGRPLSERYKVECGQNCEHREFSEVIRDRVLPVASADLPEIVVFSNNASDEINEVRTYVQSVWASLFEAVQHRSLTAAGTSEYQYRAHLIDGLFENMFHKNSVPLLRYKCGEPENAQRNEQCRQYHEAPDRRGAGGWHHDGMVSLRLDHKWFNVFTLEVIGGPTKHDDGKHRTDVVKVYKAMALSIFFLRNYLESCGVAKEDMVAIEAFGAVVNETTVSGYRMYRTSDGLYLVRAVFEFSLPVDHHGFTEHLTEHIEELFIELKSRMVDLHGRLTKLIANARASASTTTLRRKRSIPRRGEPTIQPTPKKR